MTRQENGRRILNSPLLTRADCLENALLFPAILDFDECDQRAALRHNVELANRGGVAPREDTPTHEPESQRAKPLRRKATLIGRPSGLYESTAHSSRARASARA